MFAFISCWISLTPGAYLDQIDPMTFTELIFSILNLKFSCKCFPASKFIACVSIYEHKKAMNIRFFDKWYVTFNTGEVGETLEKPKIKIYFKNRSIV